MTGRMVNISKRWGFHGVAALRDASTGYKMVVGSFVLLALAGAAVGLHGLLVGYHHVYGVTREISWGYSFLHTFSVLLLQQVSVLYPP